MNELAIVIPAYKPDFLRQALLSIAEQSDQRFNVYIGDDASPHDIKTIADEFRDKLSLSYHRFDQNAGGADLTRQWERCIALTKGEKWIWLFSDDDTMEPDCVASFYEALASHPQGELFHFNVNIIDDMDKIISRSNPFPPSMGAGEYLEAKLRGRLISFVVEFIFSKDLFERCGGFEKFDLAWGSDFMTWMKMAARTPAGIISIDNPQSRVNWRKSSVNISPDKSRPILIRKLKSLIGNAAFIQKELKQTPLAYAPIKYSFRWIRFPLGEILRNRKHLHPGDIMSLLCLYAKSLF